MVAISSCRSVASNIYIYSSDKDFISTLCGCHVLLLPLLLVNLLSLPINSIFTLSNSFVHPHRVAACFHVSVLAWHWGCSVVNLFFVAFLSLLFNRLCVYYTWMVGTAAAAAVPLKDSCLALPRCGCLVSFSRSRFSPALYM